MDIDEFNGKIALISAAGATLGRAIAIRWAERGGIVAVTDVDEARAAAVATEIGSMASCRNGGAFALRLNVADQSEWRETVAQTVRLGGGIDALFNVAGANRLKTVEECSEEDWSFLFSMNVAAVYRSAKLCIPEMRKRGGGAIINIASIMGVTGAKREAAYVASKGGIVMLTRNLAMDYASENIRVNCVCPGSFLSPRVAEQWKNNPAGQSKLVPIIPMQRLGQPEEIARPAIFLASSDASYITGAVLVVDGGLTAGIFNPNFEAS